VEKKSDLSGNSLRFLNRLYDLSRRGTYQDVTMWELGRELGFNRETTDQIEKHLEREGLVQAVTMEGSMSITPLGVAEIEGARRFPDGPTRYFPPLNVVYGQQEASSEGKQDPSRISQESSFSPAYLEALARNMRRLREQISELSLEDDIKKEIETEIAAITAQLSSKQPKAEVIRESLKSLRDILKAVQG